MNINTIIEREETIQEAAYAGNIGFEEMVMFYQRADKKDIKKMEALIKKGSWVGVKKLFRMVLGIDLK